MSVRAVEDKRIEKVMREQTERLFSKMNGSGYARCDYRMDTNGTIHMLEINPNCGIFYGPHEPGSADFSLLNDPVYDHDKFLHLIIRAAQKRQAKLLTAKMKKRRDKKQRAKQMAFA
jgi:D-alanine-D-alanine ligase